MYQPLSGLRIVDLSQVLAGPYATYQLGLMGAEVIKIEVPGVGDWTRSAGFSPKLNDVGMGINYLTQNGNKKSVTLNLKKAEGVELARRLIETADIFIENFKPGTAARLGFSYDDVRKVKSDIVYCSISAFGQDGPMSQRPAYDHIVQGMCGIMNTTGTTETGPTKVGAPYIDFATGLNAAFAIVSALHETRRTGESVNLDIAMLDTSIQLMASLMTNHLNSDWEPGPSGNEAWSRSPSSGAFDTSDGMLMLAANNERQFENLCSAIDRLDILQNPCWAYPVKVEDDAISLRAELVKTLAEKSAAHWELTLNEAGVPAGRVRSLAEMLAEDQAKARGISCELHLEAAQGPIRLPALGFKVNGKAIPATTPPPTLGQDTETVLRSLGLSGEEVERLRNDGVV
jgi:crotonobetainyl-CoA:carnitine CoA-transferase CaiB-like acyl-CoA transferase